MKIPEVLTHRHWPDRATLLRVVLSLSFIGVLVFTRTLWVSSRFYPQSPVFGLIPPFPYPFDYVVLGLVIALLIGIIIKKEPRIVIAILLALVTLLLLQDQGRLYPSTYEYVAIFAAWFAYGYKGAFEKNKERFFNTCRLILASVYVWSGLQKLTPEFYDRVFPWLVEDVLGSVPAPAANLVLLLGYTAPFIEMGLGVGLMTKKFRTPALIAAVIMHGLMFFLIGPFRGNFNNAAWEWNLATLALMLVLFFNAQKETVRDIAWNGRNAMHGVAATLFGIMPLLNFVGLWDNALSFNVYSGNADQAVLSMNDETKQKMPHEVQRYIHKNGDTNSLDVWQWCFGEFNAGPYPELRIFKNVARKICAQGEQTPDIRLVVREKRTWLDDAPPVSSFTCSEL